MIDTMYNLDQKVYLPFRISNIRVELEGDTYYRLVADFNMESDDLVYFDVEEDILFQLEHTFLKEKQND